MGNTNGSASSYMSSPRAPRRMMMQRQRRVSSYRPSYSPSPTVERPARRKSPGRRNSPRGGKRGRRNSPNRTPPRDPTSGRFLPRCQQRGMAAASRRRVAVDVEFSPRQRTATTVSSPRVRRRSREPLTTVNSQVDSPQEMEAQPQQPVRSASPPILRSNYTRRQGVEAPPTTNVSSEIRMPPQQSAVSSCRVEAARASSAGITEHAMPVSRREYASPSLTTTSRIPHRSAMSPSAFVTSPPSYALAEQDNNVVMGPSTVRRMKRMSASAGAESQAPMAVERLSHAASSSPKVGSPTEILFSYLNAP